MTAAVQRHVPGLQVLVAGGGDQEQGLRDAVARRALPITLLGWRADPERIRAASGRVAPTSVNVVTPRRLALAWASWVASVAR